MSSSEIVKETVAEPVIEVSKNRKHEKPKPWDTDDIDHWKLDEFKPEHINGCL